MRLLRISTAYPEYLRHFYAARPGLAEQTYDEQRRALLYDASGWADFWSGALEPFGIQAAEIIANANPLQRAWALEKGHAATGPKWLLDVAAAQVAEYRPDVIFVTDYVAFGADYLATLRAACPSIRAVIGWCGAPFREAGVFRAYDAVLSNVPELVSTFREQGHICFHLHHAFEPDILNRIDLAAEPDVEFSFLGSVVKREGFHTDRERLLTTLVRESGLRIWTDLERISPSTRLAVAARQIAFHSVHAARRMGVAPGLIGAIPVLNRVAEWSAPPELPAAVDRAILNRARPSVFGLEMYQRIRQSRLVLNSHIDVSTSSASNMRLFEVTGVGSCLVTDWKSDIAALFVPDEEVVTYRTAAECAEKVRYLLDNDSARRAIADAGQRRTLREHTYTVRAEQLAEIIETVLAAAAT